MGQQAGLGGGGGGWGASADSWNSKVGSKTKNIVQKAQREAKEIGVFRRLGDPARAGRANASARNDDNMRQRIRSAKDLRTERNKIDEQSRSAGRASGASVKRKVQEIVDEREEEEGEDDRQPVCNRRGCRLR